MARLSRLLVAWAFLAGFTLTATAERLGYPASEFMARRQAIAERLGGGTMILFGSTMPNVGVRNRQDNDFYYLTGNEDLNAVLVMDAATADAHLFLPKQGAAEIRSNGRNWLEDPASAKAWGFASIQPVTMLYEFLARRRGAQGTQALWVRLSSRDEVDLSRGDKDLWLARRTVNFLSAAPSEDAYRVDAIRARFPYYELKDVAPELDRLRMIKTPREIEILKANGRVSAEAMRRAMMISRAGRYEYELEAEATYHLFKNGLQGNGYPAIVGSGPNVNVWHYQDNGRRLQDGDLVVMDYGGSLDYLTIDITRTWPVSGKFDELQLRAYRCALETQKAIIAAMRPGATRAQTRETSVAIYKKYGFEDQSPASAGHFVGMAVHDVGDSSLPFQPGMVIAVEPIIEIADKRLHVRVEDTVLITDGEPLVLTSGVPKEIDEVLALLASGRLPSAGINDGRR